MSGTPEASDQPSQRRRVLILVAAVAGAALAALWLFVVPEKAEQTQGVQSVAIRWGHPLCWLLLSLSVFGYVLRWPKRLRSGLLWGAGVAYVAFLAGLLL